MMKHFLSAALTGALLLAPLACENGESANSVTGAEGSAVVLELHRGSGAVSALGDDIRVSFSPEGCTQFCGLYESTEPAFLEIMVSVDGGDASTLYNGAFTESVNLTIPNGTATIFVLIYNCDCCEIFRGGTTMVLPDDGKRVAIAMNDLPLAYRSYNLDGDDDTYPVDNPDSEEQFCREVVPEEGWLPICELDCDCDDGDPEVNPGAVEICNDATDNDCDGNPDCDDSDCIDHPDCN